MANLSFACPACGSDDTYFSAVYMKWKCESCEYLFTRKEIEQKVADSKKKPNTEVAKYTVLDRGTTSDGKEIWLWKSPAGRSFRIEEESPNKGTLVDKFNNETEARERFKELTS